MGCSADGGRATVELSWERTLPGAFLAPFPEDVSMRIGLIAPPWVPVPPPAYGGTETVLDVLARGLVAAGHEVTLFTTGEATCPVPRLHELPVAAGIGAPSALEVRHVAAAYASDVVRDADIVHDHTITGPLWVLA